ncbi:hypothetical protein [Pseudarthrobacter sp. BIM B-2242]|uniref:hypothetical protein n=1 Tax=Pseudarthrobacter sp. BIM B-2242 TaxID=2772401 RepID=UPI00168BEC06|nr:hypothetical protein [Pseudarthrobacter sp. BIM B-2242]QOD05829.1 hypothetical protein IDT60_22815 [Pseudarthrobacter sp. BIM B-2242]
MAQDIEMPDAAAHEERDSALAIFVKVAAVGASVVAAMILAAILGLLLGQDIRNGMPWDQLQGRMLTAAVMLLLAVVLIMFHWRPGIVSGKDVWWEKVVIAAASVTWLSVCQSVFSTLGV